MNTITRQMLSAFRKEVTQCQTRGGPFSAGADNMGVWVMFSAGRENYVHCFVPSPLEGTIPPPEEGLKAMDDEGSVALFLRLSTAMHTTTLVEKLKLLR